MSKTLTKRLEYVEQYKVLVGIDFGKRRNVAVGLTAKGQIVDRRTLPTAKRHTKS